MPLRVLHCPTNVGNHPQGLARAERSLGLDSRCVTLYDAFFAYEVDEALAGGGVGAFALERRRWGLLARALREFDVVHFNFGLSILQPPPPLRTSPRLRDDLPHMPGRLFARALAFRDLPLLRRAGKGIVVTFQGDDARQGTGPDVPAFHRTLAEEAGPGYYTPLADAAKRKAIAAWARHADRILYLNPDLGAFLPPSARFVPYASVDPRDWQPRSPGAELPERPVVVHAPSHRGIKGTDTVVEAAERLRSEGVAFEFRLVEGLSHREARELYERADLLVDQLLVGWYGGLAVEFMALGKPVVCFVDDETAARHAPAELLRDLPLIRATRDTVYAVLREALTRRRGEYPDWCRRARAFAETWHDPVRIAAGLRDEYEAVLAHR